MSLQVSTASPSDAPLPSCKPNLMPFHIDYTGEADVSTYFRVKPAPARVAVPPVGDNSTAAIKEEEEDPKASKRTTAAFRGRVVHGLDLDLPEGYSGVVLRSPETTDESKQKTEVPKETKGRTTRRSSKASKMEVDEEEKEKMEDAVKTLNPTATFGSFALWQPDRPANESNDEYYRALTEWTELARIMHQSE